ncbi:hypothetical protein [Azospirillum argentinense]
MKTEPNLTVGVDEFHEFRGPGIQLPIFVKKAERPMLFHQTVSPEGYLTGGILTNLDDLTEHIRTPQPAAEPGVTITAEGDRGRLE